MINDYAIQKKAVYEYLQTNTATASMVAQETGIPQKNVCRYKRELEKNGLLWETEPKICEVTGCKAWYLTTDPTKVN